MSDQPRNESTERDEPLTSEQASEQTSVQTSEQDESAATGTGTGAKEKAAPARTKQPRKPLPQWRVILHNDDVNYMEHVVESIVMITPLKERDAEVKTKLAHEAGATQLLVTHRERAELYVQQFASRQLTVTAEPEQ